MHRAIAGCETTLASRFRCLSGATVTVAAVAKHYGVKAFINMSQMTLRDEHYRNREPAAQAAGCRAGA
jgi:hypothetical protein